MAWGGARPGAGRKSRKAKATEDTVATKAPPTEPAPTPQPARRTGRLTPQHVRAALEVRPRQRSGISRQLALPTTFELPTPPPGTYPPGKSQRRIAMDDNPFVLQTSTWANASMIGAGYNDGLQFLGFPILAEMAIRAEYRRPVEIIATHMTRKWIRLQASGGTKAQDKTDKVKELDEALKRFKVRDRFRELAEADGFFGRGHLFIDTGFNENTPADRAELKIPLTSPDKSIRTGKVGKGFLKGIRTIEPGWIWPNTYNTSNPLKADWYNPSTWFVQGAEIHTSRLPRVAGREVPDFLKPAFAFGGLPMTQMGKTYVENWLRTRESVSNLVSNFSTLAIKTDLGSSTSPTAAADSTAMRLDLFNLFRDNSGVLALQNGEPGDAEDLVNVAVPLGTLDMLQAQSQEHMSAVWGIPLVELFGISPHGLNASSEGEIRTFEDAIHAFQERLYRSTLDYVVKLIMVNEWGEVDPDITAAFEPLHTMTDKELAEIRKTEAETDAVLMDAGVLAPEESRARVAADPDTPYHSLDVADMPEPPQQEGQAGGGAPGGMPGGDPGEIDAQRPAPGQAEGVDENVIVPFVAADEWAEADHPRGQPGNAGQFGSGGGGSGKQKITAPQYGVGHVPAGGGGATLPRPSRTEPLDVAKLKKVGEKMGSNPGGVYEHEDGRKFYVKQGKSKDHVRNELTAAALYHLTGTPTLDYQPVVGGGHIATRLRKLDKDNASKLSEHELEDARLDFAAHAWLANWDAVGLGGDNLGTVMGRPTALDLGGALEYRAQGAPKGDKFGSKVSEIDTLRSAKMNPDAAGIFGDMSENEMIVSARRVTDISDKQIADTVKANGGNDKLVATLIARRDDIAKRIADMEGAGKPKLATSTVTFRAGEKPPIGELNGVKFTAWNPPEDWADVDGQADVDEPEMDLPEGKQAASGVLIKESDGRVWLLKPKGGFGGYEYTFPKGGHEPELSLQANAIKEAYEETGLKVRITGFAGDFPGDTSVSRYYTAERESGTPTDYGPESEGVVLLPPDRLDAYLNRGRDLAIAEKHLAQDEANFEESKHPRDKGGKFAESGSGSGGGLTDAEKHEAISAGKVKTLNEIAKSFGFGGWSSALTAAQIAKVTAEQDKQYGAVGKSPGSKPLWSFNSNKEDGLEANIFEGQHGKFNVVMKDNDSGETVGTTIVDTKEKAWEIAQEFIGEKPKATPTFKTKKEHIHHLLTKEGGTTTAEILGATQWPSVSVPQQAAALGLKLEKWKEGGVTKYKATPMTAAEKTVATTAHKVAKVEAAKAVIKENPELAKSKDVYPPPTPQELEKAKKNVKLQLQYVPGAPQTTSAQKLVDAFNEKYEGKTIAQPAALIQKVNDFKKLQADMIPLMGAEQKAQAEAAQKAQATQAEANQKAAAALKAQQAAAKVHLKQYMDELGISETEATGFDALVKMMDGDGGGGKDVIAKFKSYAAQAAKLGYPITGFQYALIRNYINGGYSSINKALRSGAPSIAQHVYARLVNNAIDKLPKYTGTVVRGASLEPSQLAVYKPGHVVTEQAFTSTGIGYQFGGNVHYTIKAHGMRGGDLSTGANQSEKEVLFKAKTMFLVHKVQKKGDVTHIEMEEVESHG